MPRVSKRARIISQLDQLLLIYCLDGSEDSDEFAEVVELRILYGLSRFISSPESIPKTDAFRQILLLYNDSAFNLFVRMSRRSFGVVLNLLKDHEIFKNDARIKQERVWVQLMVVLSRLGCDGNGASIGRIAGQFGVSYGSVELYTHRVFVALVSIKNQVIYWPNEAERILISDRFNRNHGMPGTVGIIDGTPVNLMQRPHIDGEVFWTRKCRYSMNLQLVCDDQKLIRFADAGIYLTNNLFNAM